MRVTFLTTQLDFSNGGGSNFDRLIKARSLGGSGCRIRFVTTNSRSNRLEGFSEFPVIQEQLSPEKFSLVGYQRAITDIMKKFESDTDIYYVDGHVFLLGAGFYRAAGGKPVIAHFENYGFPTGLLRPPAIKRLKYWFMGLADRFVFSRWQNTVDVFASVSPVTAQVYEQRGLNGGRFMILPNFIDFSIFKEQPRFECPSQSRFHVLYNGRLIYERDVATLIRAVALLKDVDIGLDIVGTGPELAKLKTLANELGISDRVTWHGRIEHDQLGPVYRHADIVVLTSLWRDALGMAAIEAMGCGVPTIVPADTGDAWGVGEAGITYELGDPKSLAGSIRRLCTDAALRKRLSEYGLRRAAQEFDYRILTRKLLDRMESLVAAHVST